MEVITVENLQRTFRSKKPSFGFAGAMKSLVRTEWTEYRAIDKINFRISRGERVAFVGPNGAGKSTTIKILCGILYPTLGNVKVVGMVPWLERKRLARKIGVVFGQRSQLWYHLPAMDSFKLLSKIYDISENTFVSRRDDLIERFEIQNFVQRPVRQLSLGERMRCEIVGSLLHEPEVLFLDEPTVGLDVNAKSIIRDLIKEYSNVKKMTVLLTSHDTGDIEKVCDRALIINRGLVVRDQSVKTLKQSVVLSRVLKFHISAPSVDLVLSDGARILENQNYVVTIEIDTKKISVNDVVQRVLAKTEIADFSVEDPPMDEVLKSIYKGG